MRSFIVVVKKVPIFYYILAAIVVFAIAVIRIPSEPEVSTKYDVPTVTRKPRLPTSAPSPTQIPIEDRLPLPTGAQKYTVSAAGDIPTITEFTFYPLAAAKGDGQSVNVAFKDDKAPITSVKVRILGDSGWKEHALKLFDGNSKDGVWGGQWRVEDTYHTVYHVEFVAEDEKGNKLVSPATFRPKLE